MQHSKQGKENPHAMGGSVFFVPLLLCLQAPITITLVSRICTLYNGSISEWFDDVKTREFNIYEYIGYPTYDAAVLIAKYIFVQYLLLLLVPAPTHRGPISPKGNVPEYKLNGIPCFILTWGVILFLGKYYDFSLASIYDNFTDILATISWFSVAFCAFLYFKGCYFPTTDDVTFVNPFFDFWEGTELYPEMFGVSLKQLVNCRLGMMAWSILTVSDVLKQYEISGFYSDACLISCVLQNLYIIKFFIWEGGYFNSIDIIHDRFGFMICWGCLCWVPSVYTLVSFYLTTHPYQFLPYQSLFILLAGIFALFANYFADYERQICRRTDGNCNIWGKRAEIIRAKYITEDGEEHSNVLLASGFWSLARHCNYTFEISLAFFWTLPAGFTNVLPWLYFFFLTFLLLDRERRDEKRCHEKYGKYWEQYKELVPYRVLPGIY